MSNYWFDHVHLMSNDPMKTADFYEKTFGAERQATTKRDDGRISVDLTLSGVAMKVTSPRAKPLVEGASLTGLEHFGFRTDDISTAIKELKAKGVTFVQDVTSSGPGMSMAFFITPDNVLIELQQRKEGI